MQDPSLLEELGEVSGNAEFANTGSQRRPSAGGGRGGRGAAGGGGRGYDNDDDVDVDDDSDGSMVEPDRESDDDGLVLEEVNCPIQGHTSFSLPIACLFGR